MRSRLAPGLAAHRSAFLLSFVFAALFAAACAVPPQAPAWPRATWLSLHQQTGVSLRGLSVVDGSIVWASGSDGTILRTTDAGGSWQQVGPSEAAACDFRDVHAFSADEAVAMVAGQPARVYRTEDGGESWQRVFEATAPSAFFDSIAFAGERGYLFGDPLGGAFFILHSDDRGRSWRRVEPTRLPEPVGDEAGFAASGTCISASGKQVWIATGGEASRCLYSTDAGESWSVSALPLLQGLPSQGAFSFASRGGRAVVVGGDYQAPERNAGSAAWSADSGRSWQPAAAGGYRSAVVWLDDGHVLAVGPDGASLSADGGRSWAPHGDLGFHAIDRAADGAVYACGSDGRIATLVTQPAPKFAVMGLFGDHMVLPPQQQVLVRGRGAPGRRVEIGASWGAVGNAVIDADGRWQCPLDTPVRGGAQTLTVRCGADRIEFEDIVIGDVWLASGQSNMEMTVGHRGGWRLGVDNWEAEVAAADYPTLRMFTVAHATSGTPLEDVRGEWLVCSPETAGGFSAAAYFFARELVQQGKGPIGVVASSWGGTLCEAWTRGAALQPFGEFDAALAATRAPSRSRDQQWRRFWNAVPDTPTAALWYEVDLPAKWSEDGLGEFDGVAFYRREIELPASWRGAELRLELGAIDDMDTVWCNGVRVGGHEDDGAWSVARRYRVPASATATERVQVLVRAVDTGGEGGFSGPATALSLRPHSAGADAEVISLAGRWQRQQSVAMAALPPWPRAAGGGPNRPAVLWNGMIAPLVPFPFAGVIWYQGESNCGQPAQYARLFPAMIGDWRQSFGRDLPFHFVQIAPFDYGNRSDDEVAGLRLAQAAALALPRTGMVVTLDIGNARDIHPRNKQEVGRRLALQALRDPYGTDIVAAGPRLEHVARDGSSLRLRFAGAGAGLVADEPIAGFELAGADGVFVAAGARLQGNEVLVQAARVAAPTQVRYAWARSPQVTLRNDRGLPAAPFRWSVGESR